MLHIEPRTETEPEQIRFLLDRIPGNNLWFFSAELAQRIRLAKGTARAALEQFPGRLCLQAEVGGDWVLWFLPQ
jgi:hypothetical protein